MAKYGTSRNPSGRPKGTGKYGEPTCTVRVPVSRAEEIKAFLADNGYKVPLFENMVSAGILTPTEGDAVESLDLGKDLVRHPEDTFCVRVQGESMVGAGILEGDILIVDKKEEVRNGKIVVAGINGGNATVKRWQLKDGQVVLLPENPLFEPISVGEMDDLTVWGVVTGVLRSY